MMRSLLALILLASAVLCAPNLLAEAGEKAEGKGKRPCHVPCSKSGVVKIIDELPGGPVFCSSYLHVSQGASTCERGVSILHGQYLTCSVSQQPRLS